MNSLGNANTYLIGICPWFQKEETFEITAESRKEALEKARVETNGYTYNPATLRLVKKINKKKGMKK